MKPLSFSSRLDTVNKLQPFSARVLSGLLLSGILSIICASLAWAQPPACLASSGNHTVSEIRFNDFFKFPVGAAGLQMTDSLRLANGKTICLVGYMVKQENPMVGRFMLTPLPLETNEHADGEADDLPVSTVVVHLDESQQSFNIPHTPGLIALQGVLKVGRHEDEDGRISWIQLQLTADQIRSDEAISMTAAPKQHSQH